MPKKKFVPMTGLDNLNEEEKHLYYQDACKHFGLPPELNLLEYLWLQDSEHNGKHLVLYCRRGGTDIIRANKGICVDEIKETIADGVVIFTAKGHDSTGRTDVAVGSASIKGLYGSALSSAVMTAQTRATRRLTLQLVGGGLLDETEVQEHPVITKADAVPVQNIAALPTVQVTATPGKDITEKQTVDSINYYRSGAYPDATLQAIEFLEKDQTPVQPESLSDVTSPPLGQEVAQIQVPAIDVPKKRRKNRRTGIVVLDQVSPEDIQKEVQAACERIDAMPPLVFDSMKPEITKAADELNRNVAKSVMPEFIAVLMQEEKQLPPPPRKDTPGKEQMKEYEKRLFVYTNDVLPKGKMKGSEGIGGINHKLKAFAKLMTGEDKNLAVNQWETLFGFLDDKLTELGPEGLVKLINQKLGVKE